MKIKIVQDIMLTTGEAWLPVGTIQEAAPNPAYTPAKAKDMIPRWLVATEIGPVGIYANEAEEVTE